MLGWRGRIGYITTETVERVALELNKLMPQGVAMNFGSIPKGVTDRKQLEEVIKNLVKRAVDCILFSCTPRVVNEDYGPEDDLIQFIKEVSGKPATTTTRAAVEAMRALSIKKVLISTPFPEKNTKNLQRYLEKNGFIVPGIKYIEDDLILKTPLCKAFGMPEVTYTNSMLPTSLFYNQTKRGFMEHRDVDGIYTPCTQWVSIEMLTLLENDIDKPVIASAISSVRWAFKTLLIKEQITDCGMLLEKGV